jgi:hypothetical protein
MTEPAATGPVDAAAFEELVLVVEQLRAERDYDHALIEELRETVAALGPGAGPAGGRVYPDWQAWVDQWLTVRISRHPHRCRWCHQYAEHPEVADRLEALWHSWELLWPEPTARTTWFRDALDHHLIVITSDDGPLRECSAFEEVHVVVAGWAGGQVSAE